MNAQGKVLKEAVSSQEEFISHRLKREHCFKAKVKDKLKTLRRHRKGDQYPSTGKFLEYYQCQQRLPVHKDTHWDSYEARLPRA